jgi:23S rRNA pseudoU1915 N3-methylase RlmH
MNKFLKKLKNSYNILLSLNGEMIDSIKFAKILDTKLSM